MFEAEPWSDFDSRAAGTIPLRNDEYVDGLRSVPRDLRKHRCHGLAAHAMPLHSRRALCCAEHLLDRRCRLFMRLRHSAVDHGFSYAAQSHALNVGQVIGVHNVAVSPLHETTAPENDAPG